MRRSPNQPERVSVWLGSHSLQEPGARPDTSDSDFGVRRLVAALPFSHGIFGNLRGETVNIPFQFQVKSAGQTNVVPRAKLFEKESGDESPHSKGRLFRAWNATL